MTLEYLAGLVDGEGCIVRRPFKNGRGVSYVSTRLIVVQSEKNNGKELVEEIKKNFGGNVSFNRSAKYGISWRWTLSGKGADELIKKNDPYTDSEKGKGRDVSGTLINCQERYIVRQIVFWNAGPCGCHMPPSLFLL